MADLIVEFTYTKTTEIAGTTNVAEIAKKVEMEKNEPTAETSEENDLEGKEWAGSRADIMLISPEEDKIHYALCFGSKRQTMK